MADRKFLTAPLKTDRMPPGIPYIVGNEAAERFNFYGMRTILVVFMTKYLVDRTGALAPMSDNDANGAYHLFLVRELLLSRRWARSCRMRSGENTGRSSGYH